jgi:Domain of unknown function (DUF4283)/Zinc knuckle
MSSKNCARYPQSLISATSLTESIWPDNVKHAYASSLIHRFGLDSGSSTSGAPPSYAHVVASHLPLQSSSTGDKITLQQINTRRASQFHSRRGQWLRDRCLRCGEKGHRAKVCRNARVCFVCGSLGHRSASCSKKRTQIPNSCPTLRSTMHKNISWQPPSTNSAQDRSQPHIAPMISPLLHRICLFNADAVKFADEVKNNLILTADHKISPSELLDGLRSAFPSSNLWAIRYLGACKYQILGPDSWRRELLHLGFVVLRQHRFVVSSDLSCLYANSPPLKIWIRIFDLDYDMWGYQCLAAVVHPFGKLLDVDFNTRTRADLCFARILVEVADVAMIPPCLWVEVCRSNDWVSYVKSRFAVEELTSLEAGPVAPSSIPATLCAVLN